MAPPFKLSGKMSEVAELYQAGRSTREIAALFGVSDRAVRNALKKMKVPSRSLSEVNALKWTEERKAQQAERIKNTIDNKGRRYTLNHIKSYPSRRGASHHWWRGGKTRLILRIRTCAQYKEWRKKVYRSGGYHCSECGARLFRGSGITLHAHHRTTLAILLNEHKLSTLEEAIACTALWDEANGKLLCESCHKHTDSWGIVRAS